MKTWSPDASEHFEAWLGRARLSVAGDPSVDADDIAQDLRAHVHAELEAMPEPVTVGALERVLDSLGNPAQWSDAVKQPEESPSVWFERNVTGVVREWQQKLAGDWGLPVLLLVMTLIAIPTFNWIGAPLLLFAYFVARSQVTYAPHKVVGRKAWMIYFPLAIGAGVLAGLVLGFPLSFRSVRSGGYVNQFETLWVLGSWWVLLGILAAREPKRVRAALKPFADTFDASHARMLSLVGAAFLIASSVILLAR
jgi:hypothetical protein